MFRPLAIKNKTKERMLTMQNMLSEQLQDFLGLIKQLITNLLGKDAVEWANELKKLLRKEPCWAEGMINIPIEWGPDMMEVSYESIQEHIKLHEKGYHEGWRLPTEKELYLALKKMKPNGFTIDKYYWTSTPASSCDDWPSTRFSGNTNVMVIIHTYDGRGGVSCEPSINFPGRQKYPHLRLCRPIKLPE
jgi:hypothetical protein